MRNLANRVQNQKNAAYNLGVAEAIRIHKKEKPEFCVSLFKISVANTCKYYKLIMDFSFLNYYLYSLLLFGILK